MPWTAPSLVQLVMDLNNMFWLECLLSAVVLILHPTIQSFRNVCL